MTDALEGINEILKRANQNIVNLDSEIASFVKNNKYPIVGNKNLQVLREQAEHYGRLIIPIRFSILAGEVIHHFRSCLDHIAWQLAMPIARRDHPTQIEFPVCAEESKAASSKRKIEMIASPDARNLIRSLQPYLRPDPLNCPIWVIHDLDRIFKHRELPLTLTVFDLGGPAMNAAAAFYAHNPIPPAVVRQLQEHIKITPKVALGNFVKGQPAEVIQGLKALECETIRIIGLFESELRKR
jgi:hypothetical protein